MLPLLLSSESHVFEPPNLWQTCIDAGSEIVRNAQKSASPKYAS